MCGPCRPWRVPPRAALSAVARAPTIVEIWEVSPLEDVVIPGRSARPNLEPRDFRVRCLASSRYDAGKSAARPRCDVLLHAGLAFHRHRPPETVALLQARPIG